jgi:putative PIN family toxin of toxin-antitoxin system
LKVFLDTNVLASAFNTRGLCNDVFLLVIEEHELVTGEIVLEELKAVLRRKFGLPATTVSQIDSFLRKYQVESLPQEAPTLKLSDHNDLLVIASALSSGSEIVVTGDAEILRLEDKPIPIVSPREFWTLASRRKNKR